MNRRSIFGLAAAAVCAPLAKAAPFQPAELRSFSLMFGVPPDILEMTSWFDLGPPRRISEAGLLRALEDAGNDYPVENDYEETNDGPVLVGQRVIFEDGDAFEITQGTA